ncbi:pullulanase [Paenibacillus psychroresistens]|uniref:Pullulanase n=1 Tax=Paenibacillus psychroresistens TaxID=1778678 RepID=A0A6B8RMW2_9BACL|nr:DUF6509 family protein [Paenibacillus psychroresistens]QGQ97177.1 pullulanase [Paenibacillus psychroresistens]
MLTISSYTVELIKDPFGILSGKRYEFLLDLDVPDDDELYSENGMYVRALYLIDENKSVLLKYEIFEKDTEIYQDFDLEDDEVEVLAAFCKANYAEAEE